MRSEFLGEILDATGAAVMTLTPDGLISSWSRAAEELYGYTCEYALGRAYVDLIIPADRCQAALANLNVVLAGTPLDFETVHRRRDGDPVDVVVTALPLGRPPAVEAVAAIVRDISRQKSSERQLRATTTELRGVVREREEFLAMIAHEIRLPAAGIQLLSDGLAKASGLTAGERQAVRSLQLQAHALANTAEMVLAIGRLDRGEQLDREEIDVRSLLHQARDRAMDERVRCVPLPEPLLASVDKGLLLHALMNLITNALRYSTPPSPVVLSAAAVDDRLQISVADEGIGIANEDIPRVFEKYARVTTGPAARVAGVGLGLYLVRLVAQAHGGTARGRA